MGYIIRKSVAWLVFWEVGWVVTRMGWDPVQHIRSQSYNRSRLRYNNWVLITNRVSVVCYYFAKVSSKDFQSWNKIINALADPGGRRGARPPTGSISFVFTYVFAEKCTRRRLVPPPNGSAPPQREILDPPLQRDIKTREQFDFWPTNS